MIFRTFFRLFSITPKQINFSQVRECRSVFGIKDLIAPEKREDIKIQTATPADYGVAINVIKQYYLKYHVMVRDRKMDLATDCAFDDYLTGLLKQGNTLFAVAPDQCVAGICVGFESTLNDVKSLRNFANYRQDPNTKDFLHFTAKLQETPNLWKLFKQKKIFEIKMLAVLPEYRRHGLAIFLTESLKKKAYENGLKVVRMDCINQYDYKIAEHCMFQCIMKYPLHKLKQSREPFIKPDSEYNRCVRVYVSVDNLPDVPDLKTIKKKQEQLEIITEF